MFGPSNNKDLTACSLFSKGFKTEEEMSFAGWRCSKLQRPLVVIKGAMMICFASYMLCIF